MMLPRTRLVQIRLNCCGNVRYSTSIIPPKVLITSELEKQEDSKAIELRTSQAPNRKKTWAKSQRPRNEAFNHPKFEGAILEMQVNHH